MAKARARAGSRLAIVTAVGRPRATSAAKLGPDSTASGACGKRSLAISDIVASEATSIPLAHNSSGVRAGITAASRGGQIGGCDDRRIERNAGQKDRIFMPLIERGDEGGIARPQYRLRAGAAGGGGECRAPCAAAEDRKPFHPFTPRPRGLY